MRRSRIWLLISGILALGGAAVVFYLAYTAYDRVVATREIVVAATDIPPYTRLTADLLTVREMPRALAQESIYLTPDEVIGKITVSYIPAGALIYRPLAVPQAQFRYVADPTLEIVSIPVDPTRAVGGQLRVGQVVNVYRAARSSRRAEGDPEAILAVQGAAVELLATAPVVDVRSQSGEAIRHESVPSQVEREAQVRGSNRDRPLQIVTLAVPPETAQALIRLAVEREGQEYELWLTLAPLEQGRVATAPSPPVGAGISREEDALLSPASPGWLVLERDTDAVILRWSGTGSDVAYYVVYRRQDDTWREIARVAIEGDNRGEYVFRDRSPGDAVAYGVTAVDLYGNESAILSTLSDATLPAPTAPPTATSLPTATATVMPVLPTGVIGRTGGSAVIVRDAPAGNDVGRLAEGTRVAILEGPVVAEGTPWYRVRADGVEGWVFGHHLVPEEP